MNSWKIRKVESSLIEVAELLSQQLPQRVDAGSVWTAVTANDLELTYHFTLEPWLEEGDWESLFDGKPADLSAIACSNDVMREMMSRQVVYNYAFYESDGTFLRDYQVSDASCSE